MRTDFFPQRWHDRKTDRSLGEGLLGLMILSTAISAALWLLPIGILVGLALLGLFAGGLGILAGRSGR